MIALTSSSLLVQEQVGSTVPESQKRDITIPSANGDPIRISYGGNADSVKVDGHQIADNQEVISNSNANRHLQDESEEQYIPADGEIIPEPIEHEEGEPVIVDIDPEGLKDIIEMTEDDVVTEESTELAENILDDKDSTVIERANAILILLTPTRNDTAEIGDETTTEDDLVILNRTQANDIKAVVALLVANIPDANLTKVQDTVPLDQDPDEAAVPASRRKNLRSRRAKALRRVSKLRAVRRRRHRAMSMRSHTYTRNYQSGSRFGRRRVLRLAPPHFVRYNSAVTRNRHLIGTPVPKTEAQISTPVTENKEVV